MRSNTANATTAIAEPYAGRFAPSPTGPLHAGSLLAALGSWLDAYAAKGLWTIRIDDLDTQRCREPWVTLHTQTLAVFGLRPLGVTGEPWRQSQRREAYKQALEQLSNRVPLFACDCTRRERREDSDSGCLNDCRHRRLSPTDTALRADLTGLIAWEVPDRSLGAIQFDPIRQRDVIVRRRDGVIAYALACVVDDAAQGITDVVRGGDLLEGTRWQLGLHQALGLRPPRYLHLPVLIEPDGRKLAKSRRAIALDPAQAQGQLRAALQRLGQPEPPAALAECTEILHWAGERWQPERFVGVTTLPADP